MIEVVNNRNWVCFDCRRAVRISAFGPPARICCNQCGEPARYLGYVLRIPPRSAVKAWSELRRLLAEGRIKVLRERQQRRVRRRHDLEKEIRKLESRPSSEGRDRLLKSLRKDLADLLALPPV